MPSDFFIDSNIPLYILDKNNPKFERSKELLKQKPRISSQVVVENVNVCLKKFKLSRQTALMHARSLMLACEINPTTEATAKIGLMIFERYGFTIFDCMIIASALESGCSKLYSEDLNHGQVIEKKLTIVNPFV